MTRPIGTEYPERCQQCGFHPTAQGHRSQFQGTPTGCDDSGPLGLLLAREARDDGMSRTVAAHPDAVALVDAAIMRRVNARRPFSANSIRSELADLKPSERPVIGARMNSLARKHCNAVGEEQSTDVGTHGKRVTVWLSKAVTQEAAA